MDDLSKEQLKALIYIVGRGPLPPKELNVSVGELMKFLNKKLESPAYEQFKQPRLMPWIKKSFDN